MASAGLLPRAKYTAGLFNESMNAKDRRVQLALPANTLVAGYNWMNGTGVSCTDLHESSTEHGFEAADRQCG